MAIIGSGHWGSILIAKFKTLLPDGIHLVYGHQNIDFFHEEGIRFTEDMGQLMEESDAVVIASPPESHFNLAYMALEHNCHTWVEKPMCLNSPDAYKLVKLANERKKLLFVDHQLCYADIVTSLEMGSPEQLIEVAGIFKEKFSAEKKLNSAWNVGIHLVALATYLELPLSKFTLITSDAAPVDIRAFKVRYANGFSAKWDLLKNKEDLVMAACIEFLKGTTYKEPYAATDGEHGLEVIRAMEWLLADWSQTVETPGEPMILPVFGREMRDVLSSEYTYLIQPPQ